MKSFILFIIIIVIFILNSCCKNVEKDNPEAYAEYLLNNRKYEDAIIYLNKRLNSGSISWEGKVLLAQAYVGSVGLEILKLDSLDKRFKEIEKEVSQNSIEIKDCFKVTDWSQFNSVPEEKTKKFIRESKIFQKLILLAKTNLEIENVHNENIYGFLESEHKNGDEFNISLNKKCFIKQKEGIQKILKMIAYEIDNRFPSIDENLFNKRVEMAISLYKELGSRTDETRHNINFQLGTIYIFRFFTTVKHFYYNMVSFEEKKSLSLEDIIQFYKYSYSKGSLLKNDLYQCYKMYKESYPGLEKFSKRIKVILTKMEHIKDKINILSLSSSERLGHFIYDHRELLSLTLTFLSLEEGFKFLNYDMVKTICWSNFTIQENHFEKKFIYLKTFFTFIINHLILDHPVIDKEGEDIFDNKMKKDFKLFFSHFAKNPEVDILGHIYSLKNSNIWTLTKTWEYFKTGNWGINDFSDNQKVRSLINYVKKSSETNFLKFRKGSE